MTDTANENDDVWVVIETHKGVGEVFSYRGRVDRERFELWKEGELNGVLSLHDAYWLEHRGDRLVPYVVGRSGDYRNARGVIHIEVSTIVIAMELEGADPGVLDEAPGAPVLTLARKPDSKAKTPPPPVPEPKIEAPEEPNGGDGDDEPSADD